MRFSHADIDISHCVAASQVRLIADDYESSFRAMMEKPMIVEPPGFKDHETSDGSSDRGMVCLFSSLQGRRLLYAKPRWEVNAKPNSVPTSGLNYNARKAELPSQWNHFS